MNLKIAKKLFLAESNSVKMLANELSLFNQTLKMFACSIHAW